MKQAAATHAILRARIWDLKHLNFQKGGELMETGDSNKTAQAPCKKKVSTCVMMSREPVGLHRRNSGHGCEDENLAPNANTKNSE